MNSAHEPNERRAMVVARYVAVDWTRCHSCARRGDLSGMDLTSPLVVRVQHYILENLDGVDLSPRAIAEANGVSVRQLHRVFSATGTTVCLWVRKARLARCAAELRSSTAGSEGITDIAFRWGFNDSAHFSKTFRAEFGQSPRAYRAEHLALRRASVARSRPGGVWVTASPDL
jgi:transcriptional regulator GlxA family with amidase domain